MDKTQISLLSFEEAMRALEGIVKKLEEGQISLDESISAYEIGALLKRHCEEKLKEAKMRVDKITLSENGDVKTEPFDPKMA